MVGPDDIRKAIEEEISKIWDFKLGDTVRQFDKANPGASLTFLSTIIRSHPKFGGFTMSQELFIKDTIKLWNMENSRPAVTPGEVTTVPLPEEENPLPHDVLQAQKIAGALIWLSTRTRPDIVYAQSRISSMATKAPKKALEEGLRVLRYLRGTAAVGLQFKRCDNSQDVIAYTDANFAVSRSQTGSFIKLGTNPITWRSVKQTMVSRSTTDSEIQAVATTEILADYVKALRESVCLPTPVIKMKCDNAAAIILSKGEGS